MLYEAFKVKWLHFHSHGFRQIYNIFFLKKLGLFFMETMIYGIINFFIYLIHRSDLSVLHEVPRLKGEQDRHDPGLMELSI